jgi:RNA polymerase sigma factor (sigma-70 family)
MSSESVGKMDLDQIESGELVSFCANDPADTGLWTEFLRRFGPKIKTFIRRTLCAGVDGSGTGHAGAQFLTAQDTDLFQNTIVRLVENNCVALKRFTGTTEAEFLAYLAVISRSVVRDCFRRQRASKRFPWFKQVSSEDPKIELFDLGKASESTTSIERSLLGRELAQISLKTIRNSSADPERDELIFQLYFYEGLSTAQIAANQGIGLSKTGVEKALNKLKDRVRSTAAAVRPVEASKL